MDKICSFCDFFNLTIYGKISVNTTLPISATIVPFSNWLECFCWNFACNLNRLSSFTRDIHNGFSHKILFYKFEEKFSIIRFFVSKKVINDISQIE